MHLGEWINQYRKEHGISMQSFADLTGFSKAYIGMLEKGINPSTGKEISPTIQTFNKIALGLGLDVNDFIQRLDTDQPVTIPAIPSDDLSPHDHAMVEAYHKAFENIQNIVDGALNEFTDADLPALAHQERSEKSGKKTGAM